MKISDFEGQKIAIKQDSAGYVLTLRIHPDEIPEALLRDFVGSRYMVAMVRVDDDGAPAPGEKSKSQIAGMLCRQPLFHKFCSDTYGVECNENGATEAVYSACDIKSRTELNGNSQAKKDFDNMVEEYERWTREVRPF